MTVVLSPIRSDEPMLTKQQIAALLGVSEDTIDEMRAAGMPCVRWGKRLLRFRASACVAWWESYEREAA